MRHTTRPPAIPAPDFDGVLKVDALARLLHTSPGTIRRAVARGTFPIPLLRGIDKRYRWAGPVVRRYLETNGEATDVA